MQTVLIVDDWPELRQRMDRSLSAAGYLTLHAHTGQEALGLLRSVRADLLLLRQDLADVEGTVLAGILRRRGLEELVIILLAESPAVERQAAHCESIDAVLPRSLDPEPARALVRRLLRPVTRLSPPSAEFAHTFAASVA